ncbi:MAG TPA: hypothetical protein VM287_08355 [Egibacteraceae bacterium]|nr:hypothetical protein [Egibacteraceae bacterium]
MGIVEGLVGRGTAAVPRTAMTINQCLGTGPVDELRLHIVPFTAGVSGGSRILDGVPPRCTTGPPSRRYSTRGSHKRRTPAFQIVTRPGSPRSTGTAPRM